MNIARHVATFIGSLLITLGVATVAFADDTEIFFGLATSNSGPNIMFIFDTSGSMSTEVETTLPYDPGTNYAGTGSCDSTVLASRVYYRTGSRTTAPGCNDPYINLSDLKCAGALTALANGGIGRYVDNLARWGQIGSSTSGGGRGRGGGGGTTTYYYNWESSNSAMTITNGTNIECKLDNGVDGNLTSSNPYPLDMGSSNSATTTSQWTATASQSYWATHTGSQYTLFSANYVIWQQQYQTTSLGTRMSIMKSAATSMLNTLNGVNVGLMRYSNNGGSGCGDSSAQGGMVVAPVAAIETNRSSLISTINGWSPDGCTPLSETLYESYLYYKGAAVDYGNTSSPSHSIDTSRTPATSTGANYNSPADYSCQKSYVVYLTDGLPTADTNATSKIQNLGSAAGSCRASSPTDSGGTTSDGRCLNAMARYMFNSDLRSDIPGQQNVTSFFVGLGDDFGNDSGLTAAFDYIAEAATAGGGEAFQAGDLSDLSEAFDKILIEIDEDSGSFTSPTVAVNAFNRTRSLSELYVSVFRPSNKWHWAGNVKKYKLVGDEIRDANGNPAIDPDGGFTNNAQSYWSDAPDGNTTEDGGAAHEIPVPGSRTIYTWVGASNVGSSGAVDLTSGNTHRVNLSNAATLEPYLGTSSASSPSTTTLINWALGGYGDSAGTDATVPRYEMGDPLHSQSAVVLYGGTPSTPNIDDGVLFTATNDGYLHAIDVSSGAELWAFMPQIGLENLGDLYQDPTTANKHYVLDGDIAVLKFDTNEDGIVDPSSTSAGNDRVLLFVSQGRGGDKYYALDVTDKTSPKFLWQIGSSELNGIGQSWSAPKIARVNVSGATQNTQKIVLIFGGGYDAAEDGTSTTGTYLTSNSVGNRLYIVDALKGNLLWSGGPTSSATTQQFGARMDHAFPASPNVVDTDGDGYADRIYIGDTAAQLWRFDIWNGNTASNLVTGGVVASLGTHDDTTHTIADARRFYTTPDSANVAVPGGAVYMAVAIGSGYRGHPLNTGIQDRFYVYRDYAPYTRRTQADYNSATVALDSDMFDITSTVTPIVPIDAVGWKLTLNQNGGWVGEKVLSGASIFGGSVMFPTYAPTSSVQPCAPATGVNRAYVISLLDGSPTTNFDHDATPNELTDRSTVLTESAIAPEVRIIFTDGGGSGGGGGGGGSAPKCTWGTSVIPCPPVNTYIKTYWREGGAL